MIKVNLLRDSHTATIREGTFYDGEVTSVTSSFGLIVKMAMLLVSFFIFVFYLDHEETQKSTELKALENSIARKTEEKASLANAIKTVEMFKKEKERVTVQIDTIKALSRERLRNVKALEALQNIFPEKAWLTMFKIEDNNAKLEGSAIDDKVVAELMSSLEENIYFANVRLIKSVEQQSKSGTLKDFSIECSLEGI